MVALIVLLFVTGILYGMVFKVSAILLAFKFVLLHFVLSGVLVSIGLKVIAERYLKKSDKDVHSAAG